VLGRGPVEKEAIQRSVKPRENIDTLDGDAFMMAGDLAGVDDICTLIPPTKRQKVDVVLAKPVKLVGMDVEIDPALLSDEDGVTKPVTPSKDRIMQQQDKVMWVDKYMPRCSADLVGNRDNIDKIRAWLHDWNEVNVLGHKKYVQGGIVSTPKGCRWEGAPNLNAKACLISGPPGIGKSSSIKVIASELGFGVMEVNASDHRSKYYVNKLLGDLCQSSTMPYFLRN
jgi:hypothetical protein